VARSEQHLARWERRFEVPVIVAAFLVIPAIAIEASVGLDASIRDIGSFLNVVIWTVFAAELGVLLSAAPDRWQWLRTHKLDVAIVLLTPPFAPASVQGVRMVRLFRLLRLLRLWRVIRLSHALFTTAGLKWAGAIAAVTVVAGGAAFSEIEADQHLSFLDGLWWAAATVTTVGYGDYTPKSTPGRALGMILMAVGIGCVALLTGAIAERFLRSDAQVEAVEQDVHVKLDEIAAPRAHRGAPHRHSPSSRPPGPGKRVKPEATLLSCLTTSWCSSATGRRTGARRGGTPAGPTSR
jgi:voltage-gated potassium channel